MDGIDFAALAAKAVAGLDDVRVCLLVSRDGLTLGAHPQGGEDLARSALSRLDSIGDPERGFLVVGDEVWVLARRGPYAGVVVASASAKAGLLLDRLESTLRAAEEARLQSGSAAPARPEAPRRPRTPLHRPEPARTESPPDPVPEEAARVVSVPDEVSPPAEASAAAPAAAPPPVAEPGTPPAPEPLAPAAPGPTEAPGGAAQRLARPGPPPPREAPRYTPPDELMGEMGKVAAEGPGAADRPPAAAEKPEKVSGEPPGSSPDGRAEEGEVDPVDLAREFAKLFDEPERDL